MIAVKEAVELGVPRSSFEARIRAEGWQRPFRGVVVLPGTELDAAALARCALLSLGPPAAATGLTALAIHGAADAWPSKPQVLLPAPMHLTPQHGLRLIRSRTIEATDVVMASGMRVASVPRAFLDAAATTSTASLRALLIDARQRRVSEVAAIAQRASRTIRAPGRGRLLRACRDVGDSGADSALVAEVEAWLRREGITLDVPPRTVATPARILHPDLTVAQLPIGIEADGFGAHASRQALDLDQRKHNAYLIAGWTVLRIGWERYGQDRNGFLAELLRAIAAHSHDRQPHR